MVTAYVKVAVVKVMECYSKGSDGCVGNGGGVGGDGDSLSKGGGFNSCRSTIMKNAVVVVAVLWWC